MIIKPEPLTRITAHLLEAAGTAQDRALTVAEHLVLANLKGHDSHGVGLIAGYVRGVKGGSVDPDADGEVVRDTGSVLTVDGKFGLGRIVGGQATELGIERAKQHGIAVVALRNPSHLGRIGLYGEMCADEGLVSVHWAWNRASTSTTTAGRRSLLRENSWVCRPRR